jgi:hypothetical protein
MYGFVCYIRPMEALATRRGVEMTEWNDGRLDDLGKRVDRVETKMDQGFARVDAALRELNGRFDALQQTLMRAAFALVVGLLGVFAALVGVIAAQL